MPYGMTWSATLDGALDHINAQGVCMSNALDDLGEFIRTHPEHENDPLLVSARIALL